jgi:hypothetical protein
MGLDSSLNGSRKSKSTVFERQQPSIVPESFQPEKDNYSSMSLDERAYEYAHTGDPEYLTPELARRMHVSPETMREVHGATPSDIAFATALQKEGDQKMSAIDDALLAKYGADQSSLGKLEIHDRLTRLLDLAELRLDIHTKEDVETVRDLTYEKLLSYCIETEGAVFQLADSLRDTTSQGIRDVSIFENIQKEIHVRFVEASHDYNLSSEDEMRGHSMARALNEYVAFANGILEGTYHPDTNYLFAKRQTTFAHEILYSENARENPDHYKPFELVKGVYATFNEDQARVYVADRKELAEHITEVMSKNLEPTYVEVGQYFARHTLADIPEELTELCVDIMDGGILIDDYIKNIQTLAPSLKQEQIDDYVMLLSYPVRNLVETDIGMPLAELSIREQLALLEYAKQVTIPYFETLQHFAHDFGSNGLRTFLVTAEDPVLRDNVTDFAMSVSLEDAQKIFTTYGKLIASIDTMGAQLRGLFGARGEKGVQETVSKMLDRARTLLVTAHEYRDNPEGLIKLVESINADNAIFYEAFRALRASGDITDFRSIEGLDFYSASPTNEPFSQSDRNEMIRITNVNYASKSDEFRSAVVKGLTDSFDSANTKFYILRYRGKIVGFNRFDDMEPGTDGIPHKYFGSFNVDPAFGNGKVGDVMIDQTLGYEAQKSIIEAHCLPDSPITKRYMAEGFVKVREEKNMYPEPVWHIVLDRVTGSATGSRESTLQGNE